jgi:hypothetical protein
MSQTTNRPNYNEANRPRRQPRNEAATANLQAASNAAAAQGGSRGTAQSAADRDRRINSAVRNPGR